MSDQGRADPADISSLSYEAALAQLDALIQKLEGGSIALEDAIAAYERGTRLARHCEELLDRTERRVSALMVGADGRMTERPLEIEPSGHAEPPAAVEPAPAPSPGRDRSASPPPDTTRRPASPSPDAGAGSLFGPARPRPGAEAIDPDDVPF